MPMLSKAGIWFLHGAPSGERERTWAPLHPQTLVVVPAVRGPSSFLFWGLSSHCGPLIFCSAHPRCLLGLGSLLLIRTGD